jgi:phenylalanyl-tRNA synthetase alpha subunit
MSVSTTTTERIAALRAQGEAAFAAASTSADLERERVAHLGRKAELPNLLRGVAGLPPEERGLVGRSANEARKALEAAFARRAAELERAELDARLAADRVDVTLPGAPVVPVGPLHLVTATRREIEDVFMGLGFRIAEGPEIEYVAYNFDALNHDVAHPARLPSDTFYLPAGDGELPGHRPITGCCAPTPRPCRCGPWSCSRPPSTSWCPAASTGPTQTPRTRPSSIRSRAWRWIPTSRSRTSRGPCWPSRGPSSAKSARSACARTSSPSPSRASKWT